MFESQYEYVMGKLRVTDCSFPEIAKGSGVPESTVKRIAYEKTPSPSVHAIERLGKFFHALESQ